MYNEKSVGILGLGSYVPERIVTNYDLEQKLDTSNDWIVDRTGIKERRFAGYGETTADLAVKAAEKALLDANIGAEELDLIIVATVTPDMLFPSTACLVQDRLQANRAVAFDLTAVCSGFIYGLVTGYSFVKTGTYRKVLIIGAETLSTITDPDDRNTAILFGDGAGAAILGEVSPGYGILGAHLGADGSGGNLLKLPAGGTRQPASPETIANRLHYIHMDGNDVFKFAVKVMGEAAKKSLENANLTEADIDLLIPHQANIRIIRSAAKRLGLPMEQVFINLEKYGNTSAASIPIALDEAVKLGRVKPDDTILLVGFGGGLTWGSCVIKFGK